MTMFSGVRHFLNEGIRFFKTPTSTNSVGIIPPTTEPAESFDLILPTAKPATNPQAVSVTTTGQIEFRDITTRNNSGTVEARNAANTALAPFRSASVAAGAATGSASISLVPATNNAGIEITGNTGLAYIDFSRTLTDDYNARLILNSATEFQFLATGGLKYSFPAPIELQNTVSIKPSGGNGVVLAAGSQSADRTFTFPVVGGNREIVSHNTATAVTNGMLLIGNTGAAGPFTKAVPTGLDGTITILAGAGTLDFAVAARIAEVQTLFSSASNGAYIRKNAAGTALEYATISGGSSSPNAISFSNANRTILSSECTGSNLIVRQTGTITTTRTVTLPSASAVTAGYTISIVDESGSPSWWYKLLIAPAGSDTIGGLNFAFEIDKPWQSVQLICNGSTGWTVSRSEVNRRDLWYAEDDMLYNTSVLRSGLSVTTSGSGASGTSTIFDDDLGAIGIGRLITGSVATGRAAFLTGSQSIVFGTAIWRYYARIRLTILPDATEDYTLEMGFSDGGATEAADGIYFLVDRSINATNILACSALGNARDRVDTGIAFSSLTSNWFEIGIEVNTSGVGKYFINGSEVSGSTTAAGTTNARGTGLFTQVRKTAGTSGRSLFVDKLNYLYYTTTPR